MVGCRSRPVLGDHSFEQRHEPDGRDVVAGPFIFAGAGDALQLLDILAADRDDEPAADLQLPFQRLGYGADPRSYQNCVEGRLIGQSQHSIAGNYRAIVIAEALDSFTCLARQRFVPLDRKHAIGDPRHDCGGIARSGTDLENPVATLHIGGIDHAGDDERLADRLALADGQRPVFIGELLHVRPDEVLTRNFAKG